MNTVRRPAALAARALVASAVVASSLVLVAQPASAGKPAPAPSPPTAALASDLSTCTFTLTFTAVGYSGTAYLRLNVATGGTLDTSIATYQATLPRSGTISKTWVFPANGSVARTVYGRGSVLKKTGLEVSGSVANTTSVSTTCGN